MATTCVVGQSAVLCVSNVVFLKRKGKSWA